MDFDLTRATAILERAPIVLREWISGLPDHWVASSGDRGDRGPIDIVGHLIHGELTDWVPRARMTLAGPNAGTFASFDREAQIARSIARQYGEEVGPWEYLPNLHPRPS